MQAGCPFWYQIVIIWALTGKAKIFNFSFTSNCVFWCNSRTQMWLSCRRRARFHPKWCSHAGGRPFLVPESLLFWASYRNIMLMRGPRIEIFCYRGAPRIEIFAYERPSYQDLLLMRGALHSDPCFRGAPRLEILCL